MGAYLSRPAPPPRVPTDTVVPLHYLDDHAMMRPIVLEVTLRFDDPLDADKIRNALDRLIRMKGWRKLGARVRLNGKGKMEYHIPQSYTKERPGFILTQKKFDVCIDEHPLAATFPRPPREEKKNPFLLGDILTWSSITRDPKAPALLNDWLYNDIPQLIFHAASFQDATLLTVSWPHTLSDAMGISMILNAISLLLHGKDEVPEYLGAEDDLLQQVGRTADPKSFVLYEYLITGLSGILFGILIALDMFLNRKNAIQGVCVPRAYFNRMYKEARSELDFAADLQEHRSEQVPSDDRFVSESDVLAAWWTRTLITALKPRRQDAPVAIMNIFDFRGLLPDILPRKGVWIGNATYGYATLTTVRQVLMAPLSHTAQMIRRSLNQHRNRPQLDAMAALHRESLKKTGYMGMFGKPDQYFLALSNWHRGKWLEVDFSPALIEPARKKENPLAGKPSYLHPCGYTRGFQIRNFGAVAGKDHEGNWWFSWFTGEDTWGFVEKEFAKS